MCLKLMDLIETNGMALLEAGGPGGEREGPGWNASAIIGDGKNIDDFTIWCGDADDAINMDALRERRVTAIVNMAMSDCKRELQFRITLSKTCAEDVTPEDKRWEGMTFDTECYRQRLGCDNFKYLPLDTEDSGRYPIHEQFDTIVSFLRQCQDARQSVLVHCMMGLNRAACAITVFLMREGLQPGEAGLGLWEAVDLISKRRAGVLQNEGFLSQLAIHGQVGSEAEGYVVDLVEPDAFRPPVAAASEA